MQQDSQYLTTAARAKAVRVTGAARLDSKRVRRSKLGVLRGGGRRCLPVGYQRDGRARCAKARSGRRQWRERQPRVMDRGRRRRKRGDRAISDFTGVRCCLQLFQVSPLFFLKFYCVTSGGPVQIYNFQEVSSD